MASSKTKQVRREFLQLAHTYDPKKHRIANQYISEKLDGMRCFWDGGLTRGMPTASVPWAALLDPRTGETKKKVAPFSTGLWSRYGNVIHAPDWFLNSLPACPLDGELWAGRGNFQLAMSICRGDEPDPRFDKISYAIYSSPPLPNIFSSGLIKNANMLLDVRIETMENFFTRRLDSFDGDYKYVRPEADFEEELLFLQEAIETQNDHCFLHQQVKLPAVETEAVEFAYDYMHKVLDRGGEGCIIRDGTSVWTPKRHNGLLKFKPFDDAEATVVGFIAGREGKQGNVLGKIGALVVSYNGIEFELGTGFTMQERQFTPRGSLGAQLWAEEHPGERLPDTFDKSYSFRIGDIVTFLYRELTNDGIPKEARYHRKRPSE